MTALPLRRLAAAAGLAAALAACESYRVGLTTDPEVIDGDAETEAYDDVYRSEANTHRSLIVE